MNIALFHKTSSSDWFLDDSSFTINHPIPYHSTKASRISLGLKYYNYLPIISYEYEQTGRSGVLSLQILDGSAVVHVKRLFLDFWQSRNEYRRHDSDASKMDPIDHNSLAALQFIMAAIRASGGVKVTAKRVN